MNMKEHILAALKEQFHRWEELLTGLGEAQITSPAFDLDWSVQDVVAHLWGWQQISLARMEAGRFGREPEFPAWMVDLPGDWEDDADKTNAWFYRTQHEKSWEQVHESWRKGYLGLLESTGAIPEKELLDGDRYPWLKGYSLADVLLASYDHHQEHLEKLSAWLP